MRFSGKLHKFDEARGFGVIRPDGGGDDLLVHRSALPTPRPALQDALTFEVALDAKGRKRATEVQLPQVAPRAGAVPDRRNEPLQIPELPRERRRNVNLTVVRIVSVLVTVGLLWALGSCMSRDLDRKRPGARKQSMPALEHPPGHAASRRPAAS